MFKVFGASRDRVFAFLNNRSLGKPDPIKVVIVLLLKSKSHIDFYKRSHLRPLRAEPSNSQLLGVPTPRLDEKDIESVNMLYGGM